MGDWILLVLAVVAFAAASIGVSSRINLVAFGLFCLAMRELT